MTMTRSGLPYVAVLSLALLAGCGAGGTTTLNNAPASGGLTVGGTMSGLPPGASIVIANMGQAFTISENGAFTLATPLANGSTYALTVATQPAGETCTIAGGSGTVTSASIANLVVTCSAQAFSLGGTIQGLNGSGLVLANGTDTVAVASGATSFTLPTPVAYTSSYAVTVKTQPAGLACTVTAGTGTMPAHAATNVSVSCTDQPFTLGGTVHGLGANTGLVLKNGTDSVAVPANATTFTLPTPVGFGTTYAVTVQTEPTGMTCTVSAEAGTMPASNVTSITVACSDRAYSVGGSISGLTASGLVLSNGSDTLTVPANATSFTMPAPVASTSSYSVTVQTQPANVDCSVSNGSGTMATSAVTNVAVTCAPLFTVGGSLSGVNSLGLVLANGGDTLAVLTNAVSFTMPAGVANGASYNVTVQAHPPAHTCSVTNGAGTIAGVDVSNVAVACATGGESVIYSFFNSAVGDGDDPYYSSKLTLGSDGNFYGMTYSGGINNDGTVFKVTPAGVETVLWSFGNANDGYDPYGGLVLASDGNFYGMTNAGGVYGNGTVFKITPAGVETVLWSFANGNDGQAPLGSLVKGSDGNLYGMTYGGGAYYGGTVFKITLAGTETVLWSFGNGSDGDGPYGGLVEGSDGNFYGMTSYGGANGAGAVFKITPGGAETVLHSFGTGTDGGYPYGSLMLGSDGNFYGMTGYGGANGVGAVFKITPGGAETVLYSFGNGTDGQYPYGSLVQGTDGNFYGMTESGGANGFGAIVEITPSGTETVLWSFGAGTDGKYPYGDLTLGRDGTLYGLTSSGGANGEGAVIKFN